jgi:hypothetical protein
VKFLHPASLWVFVAADPPPSSDEAELRRVADAACTGVGAVSRHIMALLQVLLPVYGDAVPAQTFPHAPSAPYPYAVPWPPGSPVSETPTARSAKSAIGTTGAPSLLRQALVGRQGLPDALLADDLSPLSSIGSPASPAAGHTDQVGVPLLSPALPLLNLECVYVVQRGGRGLAGALMQPRVSPRACPPIGERVSRPRPTGRSHVPASQAPPGGHRALHGQPGWTRCDNPA